VFIVKFPVIVVIVYVATSFVNKDEYIKAFLLLLKIVIFRFPVFWPWTAAEVHRWIERERERERDSSGRAGERVLQGWTAALTLRACM